MDSTTPVQPRTARHADDPGVYSLLARKSKPSINPGDSFAIELFITGYGNITDAKLVFAPSPSVINKDSPDTYVEFNLRVDDSGLTTWGGQRHSFNGDGFYISLCGGLLSPNWSSATLFFDAPDAPAGTPRQISTERIWKQAPVLLNIQTVNDVPSGMHSLDFCMTYYNGASWAASNISVMFEVRSMYQQSEWWVWPLGVIATLTAIMSFLLQIIDFFRQ